MPKHFMLITKQPVLAQVGNFQTKLQGTTSIFSRLLLVNRQLPGKSTGSSAR